MAPFLFGEAQLGDWDALAFVAVPAQAGDGDPGDARVRQVLLEDAIVKADGSMGGAWCIRCWVDVEVYANEFGCCMGGFC